MINLPTSTAAIPTLIATRPHHAAIQEYDDHSGAPVNTVPTPSACPGFHNDSWRRAEAARLADGTPHELTPRAGNPIWCEPCAVHLRFALAALPHLATQLLIESENATSANGEHVSGSRERRLHEGEKYYRCIDDIDGVTDDWAGAVRDERHLTAARPARQGPRISASTHLLLIHFDWLINEHPGPDVSQAFGLEVRHLHRYATYLTHSDEVRPERCDGVPCSRCDYMALEREIDLQGRATGYIACRNCGSLLSEGEYDRWLKMLAAPLRKSVAA